MSRQKAGFTLIEVVIAIALIVIVAAVAIPRLNASKREANEMAAIETLRSLIMSQAQLKASGAIDADGDGKGEYGYFQELSGVRGLRKGKPPAVAESRARLSPPALSGQFGSTINVGRFGCVEVSGYYFVMALPDSKLYFAVEPASDTEYPQVHPGYAAKNFACYAWPVSYGHSGTQIFYANQSGTILRSINDVTKYDGLARVIDPRGMLLPGKGRMNDSLAVNKSGTDGNFWTQVK